MKKRINNSWHVDALLEGFEKSYIRKGRKILEYLPKYSARDVEAFSLLLKHYQNAEGFADFAGQYISTLITEHDELNFTIHTKNLDMPMHYLGARNNGKRILITGDAGSYPGYKMTSGVIDILGKAGGGIGLDMRGGEIHLNGDYESIYSNDCLGDIYHKGKQIVSKGKRLDSKLSM